MSGDFRPRPIRRKVRVGFDRVESGDPVADDGEVVPATGSDAGGGTEDVGPTGSVVPQFELVGTGGKNQGQTRLDPERRCHRSPGQV